jgi:N-formylglutamate deformylase
LRPDWLEIRAGDAPLIVSFPHTGTILPSDVEGQMVSPWLAMTDTDWWVERLYDFAADLDITTVRTRVSRSVIDVNRDPSGASLYPGQATTDLCPKTTFDGDPLYLESAEPNAAEIARRGRTWFEPYHAALAQQLQRLRQRHDRVVLYDAHAIRSHIPRLFDGELPIFNIGTNSGASCHPALTAAVRDACARSPFSYVVNGRFTGGWTTRHYGRPDSGIHAIQMELACRGYMDDPPSAPTPGKWPSDYRPERAAPLRAALRQILEAVLSFASSGTAT